MGETESCVITSDSGRHGEEESNCCAHSRRSRGDENALSGGERHNACEKADDNRAKGARNFGSGEPRSDADEEWQRVDSKCKEQPAGKSEGDESKMTPTMGMVVSVTKSRDRASHHHGAIVR